MKRCFHVLSVVWLAGAMLGCGGTSPEIKPVEGEIKLTEEEKVKRDEEIQKSMQRSGYGNKPGMPAPTQPGSK